MTLRSPVKVRKVLLVALGVRSDESKELLGFQLVANESEACCYGSISDLKQRGLASFRIYIICLPACE